MPRRFPNRPPVRFSMQSRLFGFERRLKHEQGPLLVGACERLRRAGRDTGLDQGLEFSECILDIARIHTKR
jgi:hypothetical protein